MSTAYQRVYEALKHRIVEEDYRIGTYLPTEPELCKLFGVSRTTVRKAIEMLSADGFVRAQQGRGTVVISSRTVQELNRVSSITETLKLQGYDVTVGSISVEITAADEKLASKLAIKPGASVATIKRVELANGQPIGFIINIIPYLYVPGIEKHAGQIHSLYGFLQEHYNISIENATDILTAVGATEEHSRLLNIPVGAPLLRSKRLTFFGTAPLTLDISYMRGDKYEYHLSVSGRA